MPWWPETRLAVVYNTVQGIRGMFSLISFTSILYPRGEIFARGLQETFLVEHSLQVIRQRGLQIYDSACRWMSESELIGMEKLAFEC
jgi:hypothetical protein